MVAKAVIIVCAAVLIVILGIVIFWQPNNNPPEQYSPDFIGWHPGPANKNFAILPTRAEVTSGTSLNARVGIKNDNSSVKALIYVINVKAGDTDTNTPKNEIEKWIIQTTDAYVQPNIIAYKTIVILIPENAETGSYTFDVFACASETSDLDRASCDAASSNRWGTPQQLTVVVK